MPSILFVCTGNQYRSPIAAAYLRRLLQDCGLEGWRVDSAGTWTVPWQQLRPEAAKAAMLLGLELPSHTTRRVDRVMLNSYDLVLVMGEGHKEALNIEFPASRGRVFLLSEMVGGVSFDIPDPAFSPGDTELTLRDMCDVIKHGLLRITELAAGLSRRIS